VLKPEADKFQDIAFVVAFLEVDSLCCSALACWFALEVVGVVVGLLQFFQLSLSDNTVHFQDKIQSYQFHHTKV